jgi:hypothetical protein
MLIARRADTRARADFATWKMMAKLNGASTLPQEAQTFLASYQALLEDMAEPEATEAAINLIYRSYYGEMGGVGTAPELPPQTKGQPAGNVTAFKRPPAKRQKTNGSQNRSGGSPAQSRLPVALIFTCLVVVYVGIRYFWQ